MSQAIAQPAVASTEAAPAALPTMKVLIIFAAAVAMSAARPGYLGLGGIGAYPYLGGAYPYLGGAYPYLGIPPPPATIDVAPTLVAPEPVKDTPEVAQAKIEHLAAVAKAFAAPEEPTPVVPAADEPAPAEPAPAPLVAPEPVQDTPEVVKARAEHLAAVEKAAAAAAAAPEVPVSSGLVYSGLHGLGIPGAIGYSSLVHAPIAPLGLPALAHGRLVGW